MSQHIHFHHDVDGPLLKTLQDILPTRIVIGGGNAPDGAIEYLVPQVREAKLEIFANEHPPPHFRVTYGGENANFSLYTGERLRRNRPIRIKDRQVKAWWLEHRVAMAELWNSVRPSDCPVGPMEIPDEWRPAGAERAASEPPDATHARSELKLGKQGGATRARRSYLRARRIGAPL